MGRIMLNPVGVHRVQRMWAPEGISSFNAGTSSVVLPHRLQMYVRIRHIAGFPCRSQQGCQRWAQHLRRVIDFILNLSGGKWKVRRGFNPGNFALRLPENLTVMAGMSGDPWDVSSSRHEDVNEIFRDSLVPLCDLPHIVRPGAESAAVSPSIIHTRHQHSPLVLTCTRGWSRN